MFLGDNRLYRKRKKQNKRTKEGKEQRNEEIMKGRREGRTKEGRI
jgi:hypothetical protein